MPSDSDSDGATGVDPAAALSGILALFVAEREQREGGPGRRSERILARAGISVGHIATLTGHDARQVRAVIERGTVASGHTTIEWALRALP
jgi:hypothetical protein